jgi:dihydrofolate reductase
MKLYIIAAVCETNGIGYRNELVWHINEDLQHFKNTTKNHIVVMGKNTFFSIPEKYRPLPNRVNIVITTEPQKYDTNYTNDDLVFTTLENLQGVLDYYENEFGHTKCFICGGESLYEHFIDKVDYVYLTKIRKEYVCDRFFPNYKHLFKLVKQSETFHSDSEGCDFVFEEYISNSISKKFEGE